MKKKIIILLLTIFVAFLSYQTGWFQYLLIFTLLAGVLFLLIITLVSFFKKLKRGFFQIPLLIIVLCLIGTIVSFFRPYEKPVIWTENISENLEYAYKTDQSDRTEWRSFIGFLSRLEERDSIRLHQARKYYTDDALPAPMDKFHAAFIFHHSDNSQDYKIASGLAAEAAGSESLKDNYTVQWLRKAAYDRYMVSIGQPEKYNTQDKFELEVN